MRYGRREVHRRDRNSEVHMVDVLVERLIIANDILHQDYRRRREYGGRFELRETMRGNHPDGKAGLLSRLTDNCLDGVFIRFAMPPRRQPHPESPVP